ncbi:hypothetical protein [Bacillus phage vB_BanS-Thrax3]|nr:hypothetical protein [Bacillus phage vB_BanS-Thrax3]
MAKATYIHEEFVEGKGWVKEEREVVVGMPCTFYVGSDAYPAHVSRISESGKTTWIKPAQFVADKENGHDYFGNQKWIITEVPHAPERKVTKRKGDKWKESGTNHINVQFGYANAYQDPSF